MSIFIKTKYKKQVSENKKVGLSEDKHDVFISYCHKDKEKAILLFHILTKDLKLRVWMDNKGGINLGNDFGDEITNGLKSSKCIVCLISKKYMASDNCGKEIKLAAHFKKKIFLVMFDSVKLEESSVAYFVVGIQRFNLYKNMNNLNFTLGNEFQKFIQELLIGVRKT